ncbi:MAG: glycoside hydrolase [Betaproteobacteria bacterium]|nr:glycoside hydrolase [Betaproteobacteria bacterium]
MSDSRPLELVLLWHMHQPDFRDCVTGEYRLPWVYLHAFKDYSDMAAHLERHPGVRAMVNFVPVLVDQLEDYADQFATGRLRDPLLAMLAREDLDRISREERALVLDRCFRANHAKMIEPFPAYRRLRAMFDFVDGQGGEAEEYLSGQYLADLLAWYHLAWAGETVRREHALIPRLMAKGQTFTPADRQGLLAVIGEVVRGILPRWQALAARGQVEISSTPHYHPIGPLMIDFASARETQPDAPLPQSPQYPGGRQRLERQIAWAQESHERRFGQAPAGMWAAEGAVSTAFVDMLGRAGVRWTASGEGVLANTLGAGGPLPPRAEYLYRGYRAGESGIACFFRDERLSDMIGFEFSKWHGRDAAAHFVSELERIAAEASPERTPLVSVILDGENAWEYYPYNGFYFLDDLYAELEAHASIRTTTYARVLETGQDAFGRLQKVVAGSWVYGNLATWIGHPDKNRAWDLLCEAKRRYDLVMDGGRLPAERREAASRQLGACEGSDWCWWFGDYNPPESVAAIDAVYRANLAQLYVLLELPVPVALTHPVSRGGARPGQTTGAMRRSS